MIIILKNDTTVIILIFMLKEMKHNSYSLGEMLRYFLYLVKEIQFWIVVTPC
jgi:hypothetical protein